MTSEPTSVVVARFDDLAPDSVTRVEVDGVAVCLVRMGDDLYALADRCSHAEVALSAGDLDLDERAIECPKHGSAFALASGEPLTLPATTAVAVYDVRRVGDDVVVVVR